MTGPITLRASLTVRRHGPPDRMGYHAPEHVPKAIAFPVFLRIPFLPIFPGVALTEGIDMTTQHTAASAEAEALQAQAFEADAERRFDSVHDQLEADGRKREATSSEEFRQWMRARARTDEAWGQWALAMDASRP